MRISDKTAVWLRSTALQQRFDSEVTAILQRSFFAVDCEVLRVRAIFGLVLTPGECDISKGVPFRSKAILIYLHPVFRMQGHHFLLAFTSRRKPFF
jgi:hypothetical protein